MKLTSFSRDFWKTVIECKATDKPLLRDYDILKDHENGLSSGQIAIKYSISKTAVHKILNKYR